MLHSPVPVIKTKLLPPPPLPAPHPLPHHHQNTIQRRYLFLFFTPHRQGQELSLQGCSRGDDCSHFCVTRLPLTSQLGCCCCCLFVVFRRNLRRCNNLRTFCLFVTGVQGGKKTTTKMFYFLFLSQMPTILWASQKRIRSKSSFVGISEKNKK